MTLSIYTHADCVAHEMGPKHPEQPMRLTSIYQGLAEHESLNKLGLKDAPLGAKSDICLVHPESYYDNIMENIPQSGYTQLDSDTSMNPSSADAALRAVGGVVQALDDIMAGGVQKTMSLVRPPGHHAEPDQSMGFCIFSNIAIAAARAKAIYGLERIAIIDFDVHHGNGTEAAAQDQAEWLFISSHQMPLYPGTGARSEMGKLGNIINIPLDPLTDGMAMRQAFEKEILPAVDDFKPEIIMVSAGFDAHSEDPLAQLFWTDHDYGWIAHQLNEMSEIHCDGRLLSTLEGGYNVDALARSLCCYLEQLL